MARKGRIRHKGCDGCERPSDVLYRVSVTVEARWQFLCPACQSEVAGAEHYRYGGTWKARKRH